MISTRQCTGRLKRHLDLELHDQASSVATQEHVCLN